MLPDAIEALGRILLGDKYRPQLIHHAVILRQRLKQTHVIGARCRRAIRGWRRSTGRKIGWRIGHFSGASQPRPNSAAWDAALGPTLVRSAESGKIPPLGTPEIRSDLARSLPAVIHKSDDLPEPLRPSARLLVGRVIPNAPDGRCQDAP
jgi:hypothetical protein